VTTELQPHPQVPLDDAARQFIDAILRADVVRERHRRTVLPGRRAGAHGASVEEISAEAGYTTGAIYSRFGGKVELFLAVLDEHTERRRARYEAAALEADDMESAVRAVAGVWTGRAETDPDWTALVVEFWTHAAREETFRAELLARHEAQLDAMTELVEELAERHGVTFRRSGADVARVSLALGRGLSLEQLVDPGSEVGPELEELLVATTLALLQHAEAAGPPETS
jgi:AcrR family transcriptional regulator